MMGVLSTDDNEKDGGKRQPIIVGTVEILPMETGYRLPATNVRSIMRAAIEKSIAQRSEKQKIAADEAARYPKPTILTGAPCELCFNDARFERSTLCLRCINVKAVAEHRALPLLFDHPLTVREYLGLCALVGLLLFCISWFDAQPNNQAITVGQRSEFETKR